MNIYIAGTQLFQITHEHFLISVMESLLLHHDKLLEVALFSR